MSLLNSDNKNMQLNPLFNSKLFLCLDINQDENDFNNENNNKKDLDYSSEFEEMNYLSHELIKDLNMSINIDENNDKDINTKNIKNSLISLAKDGYKFKPKNYKPENNYKEKEYNFGFNINKINKFSIYKLNKRRENKNDWICLLCNNLNFSFRKICNKCKTNKIISDINYNYNLSVF